jgi:hypothetical protein
VTLALGWIGPASAQAQARLDLGVLTLLPGESGVIDAVLSCSPQCGSADLTLTFDPALVRIDELTLGGVFGNVLLGQVAVLENSIDNRAGQIDLALLSASPVPQPTDSVLFTLAVTLLAPGETEVRIANARFSDLRGANLEGETTGALISGVDQAALDATATQTAIDQLPTPTPTEAAPAPTDAPTPPPVTGEACTISTVTAGVPIHVGPSRNRAIRGSVQVNTEVAVTGQFTDEAGLLWWRVQPEGVTTELDRYWVLESDVDERGDCATVPQTEGSAVIATGAGFSHTFAPGERSFSHTFTLNGNSTLTCSGNPTYPEFQVGNQRSGGQTSLNLSGTGGRTLTVFSTVVNAGQTVGIANYSCVLARR